MPTGNSLKAKSVCRWKDAKNDPRVRGNLAVKDLNVIAYVGVPLRMPDGSVLGSLCAIDDKDRDWTPEDVSALNDLAQIAMDEIALRLAMAKDRESEWKGKHEREVHDRLKGSLAAVQSILDMSADMATSLTQFREAVIARSQWRGYQMPNFLLTDFPG